MPVTPVVITIAPHRSAHGPKASKVPDSCATLRRSIGSDDRKNCRALEPVALIAVRSVSNDGVHRGSRLAAPAMGQPVTRGCHSAIAGKPAPTLELGRS